MLNYMEWLTPSNATAAWKQNIRQKMSKAVEIQVQHQCHSLTEKFNLLVLKILVIYVLDVVFLLTHIASFYKCEWTSHITGKQNRPCQSRRLALTYCRHLTFLSVWKMQSRQESPPFPPEQTQHYDWGLNPLWGHKVLKKGGNTDTGWAAACCCHCDRQ